MSYETRAYDKANDDGFPPDPVVILVATGTHDVSRLVNLLAGNRMALCEHGELAHQIRRQVKRHNGGREALKLLAHHGGPDLLEIPDRELAAVVKDATAEVKRLRATEKRVRDMHSEFRIYDECGHHHAENDPAVKDVDNVGLVCEEGYAYSICQECCTGGGREYQTETCAGDHATNRACWPCKTIRALDGGGTDA